MLLAICISVFVIVSLLMIWALCKVSARSDRRAEDMMARIEPDYHTQLVHKYACLDTPEELASLAAQKWAGD